MECFVYWCNDPPYLNLLWGSHEVRMWKAHVKVPSHLLASLAGLFASLLLFWCFLRECSGARVCGGAGRNQFSFSTWIPGYYTQEQVPLPLDRLSAAPPPTPGLSPDWTWTSWVAEDNLDFFVLDFFFFPLGPPTSSHGADMESH